MFKPAPLVAVGIVVLLLAAPFAIGSFTESGLRDQIAIYDQNPSISATVEGYERGWFDSTARLRFGLSDPFLTQIATAAPSLAAATLLSGFEIPVIVEIAHGPVLMDGGFGFGTAAVRAYIDPESPMVAVAENLLGLPYLFEFRGRAGFGTGFRFEGEIPGAESALDDLSYSFSGLDYSGRIRNGDTEIEAATDNLSVQSPFFSAILESLTIAYDFDYEPGRVGLADAELSVARVAATNPLLGANPIFSATDFGLVWNSDMNDDGTHIDGSVVYRAASLVVANELSVSDVAIGIGASHLDAGALLELQQLGADMQRGADNDDQVLALLTPILDQLIAGDPVISFDPVRFTMTDGEFDGRARISIDSSALPTGSFMEIVNPLFALSAISAEVEISIAKSLARYLGGLAMSQQAGALSGPEAAPMPPEQMEAMAAAQFDALIAQGLLLDDGEHYSTSIQYAGGVATANGQPIPLFGF